MMLSKAEYLDAAKILAHEADIATETANKLLRAGKLAEAAEKLKLASYYRASVTLNLQLAETAKE